jgi:hypothetical protein
MPTLSSIVSRVHLYIIGGLAISLLAMSTLYWVRGAKLQAEVAGREADRKGYQASAKASEVLAYQEKAKQEKEYEIKAKESNENYLTLSIKYRASVLQYSRLKSIPRKSLTPSSNTAPEVDNGPSGDTLIPVSLGDLNICATNTARVVATHKWGETLAPEVK